MRLIAVACLLALAACGADGPPVRPTASLGLGLGTGGVSASDASGLSGKGLSGGGLSGGTVPLGVGL